MRTLKPDEIEVRIGQVGQDKNGIGYATLLLYKNARTDMHLLWKLLLFRSRSVVMA